MAAPESTPPSVRRRSLHPASSPERPYMCDFIFDARNTELSHLDALAAALAEHERVRERAIRALALNELQEEHRKVLLAQLKEKERLAAEAALAAEELQLRALLPVASTAGAGAAAATATATANGQPPQTKTNAATPSQPQAPAHEAPGPPVQPAATAAATNTNTYNPFAAAAAAKPPMANPPTVAGPSTGLPNPFAAAAAAAAAAAKPMPNGHAAGSSSSSAANPLQNAQSEAIGRAPAAAPTTPVAPKVDRHAQVHQALKQLRQNMLAQSKYGPLKGKLGDMRREIRKSIGQLTDVRGANNQPVNRILSNLREALDGRVPSQPVFVNHFVLEPREPVQGSAHNEEQLPSLFIYLLNVLSKTIISQFINECSAKPETADPIGVVAAQIFSQRDFQWRGRSLIDIMLAKFRVACPVLFGYRASDRTAAGRLILGWKPNVDERAHANRMTGLGAGFASIALRDFSKASKANPFPPHNYWTALSFIVNTPPALVSDSQLTVLKAMVDGQEQRFIHFYGTAAIAALRIVVVDFPRRVPKKTPAVGALVVLGDVMRRERGLDLS